MRRLAELLRIATMRREAGLKTVQVSLHLVFQGGAGTGKTTVARLFGRLYKSLGLLATDRVVEVTREDLVSGYVGQTASKTSEVINGALDGVLFLDEAYGLVRPGSQGDFGPEAVVELLKRMEDDRDRLAVIAAGYPHEMTEFLASNSGFRSRFGETIHFEDYGPAELVLIFEKFARDADYALQPAARDELELVMERLHAARDRYFGNARTARNLFDDVVAHQAERLLASGTTPDRTALMELTQADVQAASTAGARPAETSEPGPSAPADRPDEPAAALVVLQPGLLLLVLLLGHLAGGPHLGQAMQRRLDGDVRRAGAQRVAHRLERRVAVLRAELRQVRRQAPRHAVLVAERHAALGPAARVQRGRVVDDVGGGRAFVDAPLELFLGRLVLVHRVLLPVLGGAR